eukprot:3371855-Prymnesium_polylepis.1
MASQAAALATAWWLPAWQSADVVTLSIGHHFRNVDGSYGSYDRIVTQALASFAAHSKPTAQLLLRTSNVGHAACDAANAPLSSRAEAWAALGGWAWRPMPQGVT